MAGSAVAVTGCQVAIAARLPLRPHHRLRPVAPAPTDGPSSAAGSTATTRVRPARSLADGGAPTSPRSATARGTTSTACRAAADRSGPTASAPVARSAAAPGDCRTRRVYCNYFRYGQCHTEIANTGPIVCRVVDVRPAVPVRSRVPQLAGGRQSHGRARAELHRQPRARSPATAAATASAVSRPCSLRAARSWCPRPAVSSSPWAAGYDGSVGTRTLLNGAWTPWSTIGGQITSGLAAVAAGSTDYVVTRGRRQRDLGEPSQSPRSGRAGTRSAAEPFRLPPSFADGSAVQIFVRGSDDALWANRYNGSTGRPGGSGSAGS